MIETDTHILERLRAGDSGAFELLFTRHYSQVYRAAYGLVRSHEQAEDLVQESFLALYRQPPQLEPEAPLVAWLCRVALNRGYNLLRGQRREEARIERLPHPGWVADPYEELLRTEERAQVRAALAQLPERQAQLLALRFAGMAYAEIAAALGIAPGSVGTLLTRAERAFLTAFIAMNQITASHTESEQS